MQHVWTTAQMQIYQKNGNNSPQTKLNVVPETSCISDVLKKSATFDTTFRKRDKYCPKAIGAHIFKQ